MACLARPIFNFSIHLFSFCKKQHLRKIQLKKNLYKKQECIMFTPTWRVGPLIYYIVNITY